MPSGRTWPHCKTSSIAATGQAQPTDSGCGGSSLLRRTPAGRDPRLIDDWMTGTLSVVGPYPRIRSAIFDGRGRPGCLARRGAEDPDPLVALAEAPEGPAPPDPLRRWPTRASVHPEILRTGQFIAFSSQIKNGAGGPHPGIGRRIVAEELRIADVRLIRVVNQAGPTG